MALENEKSRLLVAVVLMAVAFMVAKNLGQADSAGNFFYAVLDFIATEAPHTL